jgi:hypothetical protein
VVAYPYQEA